MEEIVHKTNVTCIEIIAYGFREREVRLVWVDDGMLGISIVYGGEKPFLVQINPALEHSARDRAVDLVTGAMALMMLWSPPSMEAFSRCFDVANVMVYWDTDEDRRLRLAKMIGPTAMELVMKEGWPQVQKLNARILSESDRIRVSDVCRLYFRDPVSTVPQ
jgi:hypothetical protein